MTYEEYVRLRDLNGLRDIDVARKAGIQPSTFSEWKKGKCTPKQPKMSKIEKALGLPPADTLISPGQFSYENPDFWKNVEEYQRNRIDDETIIYGQKIKRLSPEARDLILQIINFIEEREGREQ